VQGICSSRIVILSGFEWALVFAKAILTTAAFEEIPEQFAGVYVLTYFAGEPRNST
jgi:hypothetical protein